MKPDLTFGTAMPTLLGKACRRVKIVGMGTSNPGWQPSQWTPANDNGLGRKAQ